MSDHADNSDEKIEAVVTLAREKAARALINSKLRPIIFELEGERCGICHWCESNITPGTLFCPKDPHDTGLSCSEMYDHDQKRRKDQGI